jgi:hypothetical protein
MDGVHMQGSGVSIEPQRIVEDEGRACRHVAG